MRIQRKWTVSVAVTLLMAIGLLAWFREPLLVAIGRWLVVERPLQSADVVVALGGDRERQEAAVGLLKQGQAQWVLFVGSDVRLRDYECLGVPAERVVAPPWPAYTTQEEALATREVVEERGFRSVLVVTSPYHLRRALWTFRRVLRDDSVTIGGVSASDHGFSIEAWWKSHIGRKAVLTEYVGLLYYWLTL